MGWVVGVQNYPWHPWGLAPPSSAPSTTVLEGAEDAEGILVWPQGCCWPKTGRRDGFAVSAWGPPALSTGPKGGLVAAAVTDFGAWRATDSSGNEGPKAAWSRAQQTMLPQLWKLFKAKNDVNQEGILLMLLCAQTAAGLFRRRGNACPAAAPSWLWGQSHPPGRGSQGDTGLQMPRPVSEPSPLLPAASKMKLQLMDTMGHTELLLWPWEGSQIVIGKVTLVPPCRSWCADPTGLRGWGQPSGSCTGRASSPSLCACRKTTISPGLSAAGGIPAKKCVLDARDRSE